MSPAPTIFLSYASDDRDFATRLAMDLRAGGAEVWIDQEEMRLGDVVVDRLQRAIAGSDFFAVILSRAALASAWVRKEVEIALWRETDSANSRFVPLLYGKCDLPSFLKDRVYADFTQPDSYAACVSQILQRVGLCQKPGLLVYDLGGGTFDCSVIRIKDEYRGRVNLEELARDMEAVGRKHELEIRGHEARERTGGQQEGSGDSQ